MSSQERPFIEQCSFCGDGLVRFHRCSTCDHIVAMCDECELMWSEIADLSDNPHLPAESSYPQCPRCGAADTEFLNVSSTEIEENHLDQYSAGESV